MKDKCIICGVDSLFDIDEHINYREMILLNIDDSFIDKLGIDKSKFQFNDISGKYILEITGLYYNSITDNSSSYYLNPLATKYNTLFYFDKDKEKFLFNIIEIKLPGIINKGEINTGTFNAHFEPYFIFSVKQSFSTASHYKINLDQSYSNIYSVSLISSSIPNAAYTFNGNRITFRFDDQNGTFVLMPSGFYSFSKSKITNTSNLVGYYADVNFVNNSTEKAELFSVSSEISESSK